MKISKPDEFQSLAGRQFQALRCLREPTVSVYLRADTGGEVAWPFLHFLVTPVS
jgi:hypothetical protein